MSATRSRSAVRSSPSTQAPASQKRSGPNPVPQTRRVKDGAVFVEEGAKGAVGAKRSKRAKAQSKPAPKGSKGTGPASRPAAGRAKSSGKRKALSARTADPMRLYQLAVQSPDVDARFLARVFRRLRGREARHLREDFCGTGYLMASWLARDPANTAEGFDIDPEPVAWGLAHNFEAVPDGAERCAFHLKDVRDPSHRRPDVRTAPNFSWMIFTERNTLLEYFRRVREDLVDDGVFVLDIYGGPEAFEEMEEVRKIDAGFTYIWDQRRYVPATGAYHCRIHFRFPDGSELRNVFDYHWRLWTLPEVVDLLRDAGFGAVETWWEGTDADGVSGNGVFRPSAKGENCPAWVTYVVASK